MIYPENLNNLCNSDKCYVLCSIYRDNNLTLPYIKDENIYVQFGDTEYDLSLNKPLVHYVNAKEFTHFTLNLELNPTLINKSLWISIRSITDGRPDLYVLFDSK